MENVLVFFISPKKKKFKHFSFSRNFVGSSPEPPAGTHGIKHRAPEESRNSCAGYDAFHIPLESSYLFSASLLQNPT